MNRTQLIWLLSLLWINVGSLMAKQDVQFNNHVNLALRQAGHCLLLAQNDSTTSIPPVYQNEKRSFTLSIHGTFNYDTLPYLLHEAFDDYNITMPYTVMVKNCDTDIIFLGYSKTAFERGVVSCVGREQDANCANIVVQFIAPPAVKPGVSKKKPTLAWLLLPIVMGGLLVLFRKAKDTTANKEDNEQIALGQYYFDPKNQCLTYGEETCSLTFRENKLLHLFATHPNEILTRAAILAAVWEDEGVIVGRSLDVFISRLRKQLKRDSNVQIKNIHGVGYRLELPHSLN